MSSSIRLLDETEVRALIDPAEALKSIGEALDAFAAGKVNQPAPWHVELPESDGEVHIKGAHLAGDERLAVKLATGFYRNPEIGLASSGGFSVVLDAQTGAIETILADNGYLTDLRTGLAGAIAADVLAIRETETVAVIGTGIQARHQLQSLLLVRQPLRVLVFGRDAKRTRTFVDEASAWANWNVELVSSAEAAVEEADVVITTTPSRRPVICGDWLKPGAHVTAIGTDTVGKRELDAVVIERASVIAADDPLECQIRGELQYLNGRAKTVVSIGDVIAGRASGRTSPEDITVADLIGLGAEDAAVATLVAKKAKSL